MSSLLSHGIEKKSSYSKMAAKMGTLAKSDPFLRSALQQLQIKIDINRDANTAIAILTTSEYTKNFHSGATTILSLSVYVLSSSGSCKSSR